jgi:hypothetical protein
MVQGFLMTLAAESLLQSRFTGCGRAYVGAA